MLLQTAERTENGSGSRVREAKREDSERSFARANPELKLGAWPKIAPHLKQELTPGAGKCPCRGCLKSRFFERRLPLPRLRHSVGHTG